MEEEKPKAEKVAVLGIKKEPGFLYYVDREGDVSKFPMRTAEQKRLEREAQKLTAETK